MAFYIPSRSVEPWFGGTYIYLDSGRVGAITNTRALVRYGKHHLRVLQSHSVLVKLGLAACGTIAFSGIAGPIFLMWDGSSGPEVWWASAFAVGILAPPLAFTTWFSMYTNTIDVYRDHYIVRNRLYRYARRRSQRIEGGIQFVSLPANMQVNIDGPAGHVVAVECGDDYEPLVYIEDEGSENIAKGIIDRLEKIHGIRS